MKSHLMLGLRLGAFVAAVVLMLSGVNVLTRDVIARREAEKGQEARSSLLAGTFSQLSDFTVPEAESSFVTAVYRGEQDGVVTGYCFDVAVKGYNEITMIVGINTDLTVTGVRILSHSETPGVGTKAVAEDSLFMNGFTNLPYRNLDDLQGVSGATVSSEGVLSGVRSAVNVCRVILEEKGE